MLRVSVDSFCNSFEVFLNNGVPVKIVLDVVGREHASDLEVSGAEGVGRAQLTVVACMSGGGAAEGGQVGVSGWSHQRHGLSGVQVQTHCAYVLVVLSVLAVLLVQASPRVLLLLLLWLGLGRSTLRGVRGKRGPALRRDHSGCREELVYRRAQVGHLRRVQRPVVELCLAHALLQTLERREVDVSPVVAGGDAAALFEPVQVWIPV